MSYHPLYNLLPIFLLLLAYAGIVAAIFLSRAFGSRRDPATGGPASLGLNPSADSPDCWTCRAKFGFSLGKGEPEGRPPSAQS